MTTLLAGGAIAPSGPVGNTRDGRLMLEIRASEVAWPRDRVAEPDDGAPSVVVDGEEVRVRFVDGKYAPASMEPLDDLLDGARESVRLLPTPGG